MGAQWANGIRFVSGMGFSTVSEFWQLGNLGTPDPSVPTMALDVPSASPPPPHAPPPIDYRRAAFMNWLVR